MPIFTWTRLAATDGRRFTRDGPAHVDLARREEPEGESAAREASLSALSRLRPVARAAAAADSADPAPGGGILLAPPAAPGRPARPGARGPERTAGRLAMASRL